MGVYGGPNVSEDGLVLALDGANFKSFKGEVTTNLIPNPTEEMPRGEFGQYRDLASIFDTNGLTAYSLSMDIKTNIPGNVYVYMQNGSYTKYGFVSSNAYCTTEYQRFYFNNLTPVLSSTWQQNTPNDNRAVLATYTGYGSGINPTVKDIQLEQRSYSTKFVSGTRGATVATGGGWADLIGNGNNGELVNGVRESSDNLGSLVFDGSNDNIVITNNSSFNVSDNITLEMWIKLETSQSDNLGFLIKYASGYLFYVTPDAGKKFAFDSRNGDGTYYRTAGTTNIQDGVWKCLTAQKTGLYYRVYVNGVLEGTTIANTVGDISGNVDLRIGTDTGTFLNGKIGSFKIYSRALTAAEVSQNYNALRGRFGI